MDKRRSLHDIGNQFWVHFQTEPFVVRPAQDHEAFEIDALFSSKGMKVPIDTPIYRGTPWNVKIHAVESSNTS